MKITEMMMMRMTLSAFESVCQIISLLSFPRRLWLSKVFGFWASLLIGVMFITRVVSYSVLTRFLTCSFAATKCLQATNHNQNPNRTVVTEVLSLKWTLKDTLWGPRRLHWILLDIVFWLLDHFICTLGACRRKMWRSTCLALNQQLNPQLCCMKLYKHQIKDRKSVV